MTDRELVLIVAAATEGATENPTNSNGGPYVQRVLKRTGLGPGLPWCAAYVADVGVIALQERWPLPKTASCAALGEHAARAGILEEKPQVGDVFLVHYPSLGRFAHTGFVTAVRADGKIETIEGNTNDGGSRDGWGVFRRVRTPQAKDRFIRWAAA
jgi:hypothetical protein